MSMTPAQQQKEGDGWVIAFLLLVVVIGWAVHPLLGILATFFAVLGFVGMRKNRRDAQAARVREFLDEPGGVISGPNDFSREFPVIYTEPGRHELPDGEPFELPSTGRHARKDDDQTDVF